MAPDVPAPRPRPGAVTPRRVAIVTGAFVLAGAAAVAFCLVVGPSRIDLWRAITDATSTDRIKVVSSRLPRALAAFVVGGGLAVAGVVFQALIRNPLASPYILGVSAGGSLGAVLAFVFGLPFLPPAAFAGACAAIALVYAVAGQRGRVPANSLLLAGVVVNAFFGAAIMFANVLSEPRNQDRILRWLVGGVADGYEAWVLAAAGASVLAVAALLFGLSRELNLLSLGDVVAERSGVSVARMRTLLFLLSSLLTAVAVSLCGPIGFVGLVVPHILRMMLGADHRLIVPASVFGGGAFLAVVDTAAQSVWKVPLPAGVLTAVIGGPLFLVLLKRGDRARAGLDG
jgi:iron complex transport system permease protein